ncbi:MAG TPA: hypothetical protein VK204_05455 [Nocardioidaceae bacterium]|nr:hypothetical protein [Nocardioidaceae bacterium]
MKRRLGHGALADVVAVLGVFLVVGALCGVIWWLAVDPAEFVRTPDGGGAMGEVQLSKRFNPDGWYSVIAVVAGFLSGLGLTWWRSRDFRLTTVLLVPGAALAAATMALVGRALGPPDPHVTLVHAPRGAMVPVELAVSATPSYLMWPIAVLFGALMVLWSSPRRDEPSTDAPAPDGFAGDEESSSNSGRSPR